MCASVVLAVVLTIAGQSPASEIRGRVADASTKEPLARVKVEVTSASITRQAVTADDGTFHIADVAPGGYVMRVSTVGYYMLRQDVTVGADGSRDFDIALAPASGSREVVDVRAKPFEVERQESPAQLTMTGTEMKNLGMVLTDDPLRAVQGMPGVTSNNDFNSQFTMRGADFSRIGIYLDGVLLHQPFHMVEGQGQYGSITAFNGDVLDEVSLFEGAWPVKYSDRTAGILSMNTRDGNGKQIGFRVTAGMTGVNVMAEGPVGSSKRLTWFAGFRKSYLQYVLDRVQTDFPNLVFGFMDGQGKLTFQATPKHTLSLALLDGHSSLDRSAIKSTLGVNSLMVSDYHLTSLNLTSRYAPNASFLVTSHVAWMRERGTSSNPTGVSLGNDGYGEWVGRSDATWVEGAGGRTGSLSFGAFARRLRDDGYGAEYQSSPPVLVQLDRFRGTGVRSGGYGQQTWNFLANRVQFTAGVRYDRSTVSTVGVASPFTSLSFQALPATRVQLAWGQYAQYPEIAQSYSVFGSTRLLPERSTHVEAAVEQTLNEKTRLRMEFYDRQDRDLLARPLFDPRLLANGAIFFAPNSAPIANSQRGYGRGAQILLQRRTANGFTGWVSYAYGESRVSDGVLHLNFHTDNDQRHTVNVFGSYRLRPTVNLSGKWMYGSGFPIPGFYQLKGTLYYLDVNRNQLRLPAYQRVDLRMNKQWTHDKWKTTLFAEVVNLFNRTNRRFESFNGYNGKTAQAFPTFFNMFPILPSVGVVFER